MPHQHGHELFAADVGEDFPVCMMGTVIGGATMASRIYMALGRVLDGLIYDAFSGYTWLFIAAFVLGIGAFLSAVAFVRLQGRQVLASAA